VYYAPIDRDRKPEAFMKKEMSMLRDALLDLTGFMNSPQPDAALIALSGVELGRALFPLLMRVDRKGPLGIGELADLVGRDYTTVSRQIAKLEDMGLIDRRVNAGDARIKEAVITAKGQTMTKALNAAREKLMTSLLAKWDKKELADLARLMRRLADDALSFIRTEA
jgi:DNA-binding MarR family transcriptional regulator